MKKSRETIRYLLNSIETPLKQSGLTEGDVLAASVESAGKTRGGDSTTISNDHLREYKNLLKDANGENCAFIIGNGASIPFGADSWDKLIDNLLDSLTPYFTNKAKEIDKTLHHSLYEISGYAKAILEDRGSTTVFDKALRHSIYRKFTPTMHEQESLLRSVALAKMKYRNLRVYTYNYDLFLEKQISFEDTNAELPPYCGNEYASRDKTAIIHLHGIVDDDEKKPIKELVLSGEQYFTAYLSDRAHWVRKAQIDLLSNKKVLFIGSSMSDLFQLSLINEVREQKQKSKTAGEKWCCYALMCFSGLEENDKQSLMNFYKRRGIKAIFGEDFFNLPKVLNEIAEVIPLSGRKNSSPI